MFRPLPAFRLASFIPALCFICVMLASANCTGQSSSPNTTAGSLEKGGQVEQDNQVDAPFQNADELTSETANKSTKKRQRLIFAAMLGVGLIGLVGIGFGYLKINHLTRGFYSRRLQSSAIVLALLFLIAIYFAYRELL